MCRNKLKQITRTKVLGCIIGKIWYTDYTNINNVAQKSVFNELSKGREEVEIYFLINLLRRILC